MTAISSAFQTTKRSFPMDCYLSMVVKWTVKDKKISSVSYLPAYLPEDGAPYILESKDPKFRQVVEYVKRISRAERMDDGIFEVRGGEIYVAEA